MTYLGSLRRNFTVTEALARGYRTGLVGPKGNVLSVHQDWDKAKCAREHYKGGVKLMKIVNLEDLK